ncbi:MAG: tRNA pseudouridine(13) synthase TruD [Porticoccaceae bacterium]|nr:tRNA pseudouridine(13) synthase TruD [Porticoccaceae bacterium]MDG1475232.1 tRNA pseudouridine(13) synthase TruD [Porticoccaceae bacterium]
MSSSPVGNFRHFDINSMPYFYDKPLATAVYRCSPEDFLVNEILDVQASDGGEHLWILVSKRDQNTSWVAGLLAKLVGIPRNSVGFCGLKDRFAVTRQWFSLHLPGQELDLDVLEHPDFDVLKAVRQNRKLRRGMHNGNQFRIVLHDFFVDDSDLQKRIECIQAHGVPNYFGEQRFGHQGNNLFEVQKLVDNEGLKGNRHGKGLFLSAARSWLYNLVLARWIEKTHQSLKDIIPSDGPLWGRGRSNATPLVADIEHEVLNDWQDWCYALEHAGLKQQRRAFIMYPTNIVAQWLSPGKLCLHFSLTSGCYATSLLREIAELSKPIRTSL